MMRLLFLVAAALVVIGCGKISREITSWTGDLTYKCAKTNILYVQSDSGLSVLLDSTGKTVGCDE